MRKSDISGKRGKVELDPEESGRLRTTAKKQQEVTQYCSPL